MPLRPGRVRPGPPAGSRPHPASTGSTLAFVESPVQLLNVLEWAHVALGPPPGGGGGARDAGGGFPPSAGSGGSSTSPATGTGTPAPPDGGTSVASRPGAGAGTSAPPDGATAVALRPDDGDGVSASPGGADDAGVAAPPSGNGGSPLSPGVGGGAFPVPGDDGAFPLPGDDGASPPPGGGRAFPPAGDGGVVPLLGDGGSSLSPGDGGVAFPVAGGDGSSWPPGDGRAFSSAGDGGASPAPQGDGAPRPAGDRSAADLAAHPAAPAPLTLVVLSPTDPMTRGQLRRMADLARDEGYRVRWEEARGGPAAPVATIGGLAPLLRAARRIVIGDPFSRYVQLLLTITRARDLVVVDDGTATMEFIAQLARGERLVRWHRRGGRPGARDLVFAPVSASARRRLTPGGKRTVEVFSSMPIEDAPPGVRVTANDFSWTRTRFGPPRVAKGADLVGTSLVETGVVDQDRYLTAVRDLARAHGATRYFAHRREATEKLHRLATETGLQVVRPDLPLELIARRGPIGSTILSFPSTVVHTLPLALTGTGVRVAVCDIDPAWLTDTASPRAQGFLSGVTDTARDVQRLGATATPPAAPSPTAATPEAAPS